MIPERQRKAQLKRALKEFGKMPGDLGNCIERRNAYEVVLDHLRSAHARGDEQRVLELLEALKELRKTWRS